MGIKTARDGLTINFDKNKLYEKVKIFADVSEAEAKSIFNLPEDSRDWKINLAQKDVEVEVTVNQSGWQTISFDFRENRRNSYPFTEEPLEDLNNFAFLSFFVGFCVLRCLMCECESLCLFCLA